MPTGLLALTMAGCSSGTVTHVVAPLSGAAYPPEGDVSPPRVFYSPDPQCQPSNCRRRRRRPDDRDLVIVEFCWDEEGRTKDVRPVVGGRERRNSAEKAVAKWRAVPAKRGEQPVVDCQEALFLFRPDMMLFGCPGRDPNRTRAEGLPLCVRRPDALSPEARSGFRWRPSR